MFGQSILLLIFVVGIIRDPAIVMARVIISLIHRHPL